MEKQVYLVAELNEDGKAIRFLAPSTAADGLFVEDVNKATIFDDRSQARNFSGFHQANNTDKEIGIITGKVTVDLK